MQQQIYSVQLLGTVSADHDRRRDYDARNESELRSLHTNINAFLCTKSTAAVQWLQSTSMHGENSITTLTATVSWQP
jgi:hypothetical protein